MEHNSDFRNLGNAAFQRKEYTKAKELYSAGIKRNPKDVKLLNNRCMVYIKLEEYSNALEDANNVLKEEANNIKAAYRKAFCLYKLKDIKNAIEQCKKNLGISKDTEETLELLCEIWTASAVLTQPTPCAEPSNSASNDQTSPSELSLTKWVRVQNLGVVEFEPRMLHTIIRVRDSDQVMIWGGLSGNLFNKNLNQTPLFYDTASQCFWVPFFPGKNHPKARSGHIMLVIKDYAYLFGIESEIWKFNMAELTWHREPNLPFQFKYANMSGAVINNTVWMFGGHVQDDKGIHTMNNILWQYDILTSKITKYEQRSTKTWPKPRSSSAMGTIGDRYLVIFGGDLNHSSSANDLWLYDTRKHRWIEIHSRNSPGPRAISTRTMHSICLFGAKSPTHLILLGGVAISGTAFSDIWALDLNTLEWILVPTGSKNFPPRPQSSDVVINGELFVFGGIDMQAAINKTGLPVATSDVFKFPLHEAMCKLLQPTENSWKCISCLEFTSRKCSHGCNTPICSESCEDMALNLHEEECVKKGGREDPIKKKMREMENHITNLKARIESEDLKRKQLLRETEALITKTKRDEHMIRRFQEQMDELSTITINLKETIDEKSKKLAENEIQAKNEASKNQTLSLEVKTLLEELELSHKLQEKRQNVIEELSNNIKTTSDKIAAEKLQKQRLAKQFEEIIQIKDTVEQQLEERKTELESLQRRQEEAKEKELCGVCFENIKDHVLTCGHLFCLPCIQHLHKRCPLCRLEFDKPRKVFI